MAAYSRLASQSQAKFQTMKLSPLSALRAAAPAQSTISTCRSLRFSPRSCSDVNLTRTVPVAFPGIFEARNEVNWWLLTSLVSRSQEWAFFHVTFDIKRLLFRLVWRVVRCLSTKQDGGTTWPIFDGCSTPDRTARLHGTGRLHSVTDPSRPAQQVEGSAGKRDSSSRLGEGWRVILAGDESAGGHDSAANDEPEIVDDPAGMADPAHDDDDPASVCWPSTWCWRPSTCSRRGSSTSCQAFGSRVVQVRESHDNPRSLWLPACLWWDGPAITGQNTTDQEMGIAGKGWRASCPGYPSREHSSCKIGVFHVIWCQQFVLPVNGQASNQNSGSSHRVQESDGQSRASPKRNSPPSHQERRQESYDRTGPSYVARREVQLSPKIVKPPEKRTITVISSPARQLQVDGPAPMTGPAEVMDGPAGNGSATVDGSATGYGPATVDGPARDGPASDGPASDGSAGDGPASDGPADGQATVDSSDSSALHFDDPAESDDPTSQPAVGMDGSGGHGTLPWNLASGWTRRLRIDRDKQSVFSQQYRPPSTRQHWSILCLCGHYYSVGWTRVWFQIPRPARLFHRQCLLPDMTHHTGDQTHRLELQRDVQGLPNPGLHRDIPGRLSDGSGRPWDKPGVTAIPDHVLHSLDRHQWSLLPEMCLRSTSPRLWIWMTRDPFPMTRTTRVNIRRSQQQYQIFRQAVTTSKGSFKSTPLRQNERPGHHCWTWAARRWLTESRGWTSRRFKTRWFSTARIAQGLKDDKEV